MKKEHFTLYYFYVLIILLASFSNMKAQPFGGFIRFDGVDDELSVWSENVLPHNSDFTIEFWFKFCEDSSFGYQGFLGNSNNIELNMFPDSNINFYQLCSNSSSNVWTCNQDLQYPNDYEWHHLAATYDYSSDHFEFYYDGIDGTLAYTSYNFSTSGLLYIGRVDYDTWLYNHFNGYMDELRISNVIRYNGSFTPDTSEFLPDSYTTGLWHFNNVNYGNSIQDYSGNNNNLLTSGNPQVFNLSTPVYSSNNNITAISTADSFQWIDGIDQNRIISGETTTNSYSVPVTQNKCLSRPTIVDTTLEINEYTSNSNISTYPNPIKERFTINIPDELNQGAIYIVDISGKTIYTQNLTGQHIVTINSSEFPDGLYTVIINTKDLIKTSRLLKAD